MGIVIAVCLFIIYVFFIMFWSDLKDKDNEGE